MTGKEVGPQALFVPLETSIICVLDSKHCICRSYSVDLFFWRLICFLLVDEVKSNPDFMCGINEDSNPFFFFFFCRLLFLMHLFPECHDILASGGEIIEC